MTALVRELLRPPTAEETASFFAELRLPAKLEVRQTAPDPGSADHGKGLFVKPGCSFAAGELIMREPARIALQHEQSRAESLCCARCFKYLESVPAQILHQLEGAGFRVSKLDLHQGVLDRCDSLAPAVQCRNQCGAVYCSASCEQSSWEGSHQLLCSVGCCKPEAMGEFQEMCDQVSDHLWLAAAIVANTVLASRETMRADRKLSKEAALAKAWTPWRQGVKTAWWNSAGNAQGLSQADFEESVRGVATEALQLLRAALPGEALQFPALFELECFAAILGMLDLNCMGVRVGCPVSQYLDGVDKLSDADEGALDAKQDLEQLRQLLPGVGDVFCDGTGFFSIQSIINHSCEPNAWSAKCEQQLDGQIAIRAIREIQPGEELFISYIESDLPVQARRERLLQTYQFECNCGKCSAELSDVLEGHVATKRKRDVD